LSLLTAPLPASLKGLTARWTMSTLRSDLTVSSTACLFFESVIFPVSALITTGLVPLAWVGRWSDSRFWALVEPVPGSVRLSLVFSPTTLATTAIAMTAAIHSPITGQ
jgi:hypothetical protein